MEVKLHEVLGANEVLKRWMPMELPAKTSYRIMRMSKKLASEVKIFEDKRLELVKKYGAEVEGKPGMFSVKQENIELFNKDMNDIAEEVVNVDIDLLPLDMLLDAKFTPADMVNMDKFIKE